MTEHDNERSPFFWAAFFLLVLYFLKRWRNTLSFFFLRWVRVSAKKMKVCFVRWLKLFCERAFFYFFSTMSNCSVGSIKLSEKLLIQSRKVGG